MSQRIAIVGMACCYPDARSPAELWDNVLARRRAFRRIPNQRLNAEDYYNADRTQPDTTYSVQAALIEGYQFDRSRFRVAGSTYRSADLAHWLALDTASTALADAGFPEGHGLPKDSTGVLVGNSLTGEFSRANLMRLRWPYVRRTLDAALCERNWSSADRIAFLAELEGQYKTPFPTVGDETLAGGLSNTIAGRICNHFDLRGGGYTVDGACASSLLSVANASSALSAGDLDIALAGGVDLSLDPFEIVGFAKVGALASDAMRVYDARSTGFWPGEGCGMVVLMRYDDALREHRRIYAVIHGWGISSDGSGGITRPEVAGQKLALQRAYKRAGFGIDSVGYFEGHGTGTTVGDTTELETLSQARQEASPDAPPAALGTVKANIGHTKAAAGVAGLIKATMAIHQQYVPPTTGCQRPHPLLCGTHPALRVMDEGTPWPEETELRAGVSAMGFGGINAHLVLQAPDTRRHAANANRAKSLVASSQDAELFLLSATSMAQLSEQVDRLSGFAASLSLSQLSDLAAELADRLTPSAVRAAIVASTATELDQNLCTLRDRITDKRDSGHDAAAGVFLSSVLAGGGSRRPAIGVLFPGQGSPASLDGGAWRRRFPALDELYRSAALSQQSNVVATEVAQPAIITAALAGLHVLDLLGIDASVAVGHSLGELAAYHWAGAIDQAALLRLAKARGRAIAECGSFGGAMASIGGDQTAVESLFNGENVVIAGLNSPKQTVVSGEAPAVDALIARASHAGLSAVALRVSHAFHSPLVAKSTPLLAAALREETIAPLRRTVASTISGKRLDANADLCQLLKTQMTSPVRLMDAVHSTSSDVDLWIEVGPGNVLTGIVRELVDAPVMPLCAGGNSLRPLLDCVAATFVSGAAVNTRALFSDRFTRRFDLDYQPRFFVNPCELAPPPSELSNLESAVDAQVTSNTPGNAPAAGSAASDKGRGDQQLGNQPAQPEATAAPSAPTDASPEDVVRKLVADRAELSIETIGSDDRLLGDLHLTSLAVGQIVAESARELGIAPPASPTDYATATVAEVATALEQLRANAPADGESPQELLPPGVDAWVRPFAVEMIECPLPKFRDETPHGVWQLIAPNDHPLREPLRQAVVETAPGSGVIVLLPEATDASQIALLLEATRATLADRQVNRFVLVEHESSGATVARTLHLEAPHVGVCVVDLPLDHPQAVDWIAAEVRANVGEYVEAHYNRSGVRRVPMLRLASLENELQEMPLGPEDVLLVTGGGKGIAAECALDLAKHTGLRLALLGRSDPKTDTELGENLRRMTAAGARLEYYRADVTDAAAIQAATTSAVAELGPITAVLHGAGANVPRLLSTLDEGDFQNTLGPKVEGLRNVLAAVDPKSLHTLVTFGSIIARSGMQGEADYAFANDRLRKMTDRWGEEHPSCRCLTIEWSVWSGVGMGQRLGRIDALRKEGITPIGTDEGVRILRQLLATRWSQSSLVVAGRFGDPPTLRLDQPELPLLRFLERPRVFVPGVELVTESDLSLDTDPYIADHVFEGTPLLPAVVGMEAMAQVVMTLANWKEPPTFANVEFHRPIVVGLNSPVTIRIAAIRDTSDEVRVVIRSSETGFATDHFSAVCRSATPEESVGRTTSVSPAHVNGECLSLDPKRDLYGQILFHQGVFARVSGYRHLTSTECVAQIEPSLAESWFGGYLPQQLLLGDAAMRDATIHAIQPCIPHGTILPLGVERMTPIAHADGQPILVHARERSRDGNDFVYDVDVTDQNRRVLEEWRGLRLRRVNQTMPKGNWAESLLRPYVERRLQELVGGATTSVVLSRSAGTAEANGHNGLHAASDRAIHHALGAPVAVLRRPDGKPEVVDERQVSVSHAGTLTLAVAATGNVACDLEPVVDRSPQVWRDLLGPQSDALTELIARQSGEPMNTVATRVWTALECLKKSGAADNAPLVLQSCDDDQWLLLTSGPITIASWVAPIAGVDEPVALAVLVENGAGRNSWQASETGGTVRIQ